MRSENIKVIIAGLITVFGMFNFAAAGTTADGNGPDLPPACSRLAVEDGEVVFHAYAIGVQIYRWTGSAWELKAPDAVLYADQNYRGKIGTHYGGPTWESNSGGYVKATRIDGCDVDPMSSIPWLLLQASYKEGPGMFAQVSYIQRVNTAGGLKPTLPGVTVGEEKRVPYTAEYYFYKTEVE